jgi:hypothetical protein
VNNKFLNLILGAVIAFASGGSAFGATFYTCADLGEDAAKCNGNTYAVDVASLGGDAYEILVQVDTTGYTGGTPAGIMAIGLQDFTNAAFTITGFTASGSSNDAGAFATSAAGVTTNGCTGGNTNAFCAQDSSPYEFVIGDLLQFTFKFTSAGTVGEELHLKYTFVEYDGEDWNKVGSLGSYDIYTDGRVPPDEVPEPSTYALIGGALVGLQILRKRK